MPAGKRMKVCEWPGCGKELRPSSIPRHMELHRAKAGDTAAESPSSPEATAGVRGRQPDAGGGAGDAFVEQPPAASTEAKPRTKKKAGLRERLWGHDDKPTDKPTRERKPATGGKRESASEVLALVIGGAGTALMQTGIDVPVGRVLSWEAAVAGDVIDRALAGSAFDRLVLQRIAGKKMRDGQDLAAVLLLPVIIAAVERQPELATPLRPMADMALRRCLMGMAPLMKKREAEEREWRETIADLIPPDAPADFDPLAYMWDAIFAPPTEAPPAPPGEPSSNGAGAHAAAAAANGG